MNVNFYQRSVVPTINYQGYNLQTLNYRQINVNGINGNILYTPLYPQQQNINPNTTLTIGTNNLLNGPQNLKASYNNSIHNRQFSGQIKNVKSFNNRANSANNYRKIGIKKGQLYSSGTLISSKKSRKENKVMKNGNEISNIDINNDNEENRNDGFRSVSTSSLIKDDYLLNKNVNGNFNSNGINAGPTMENQNLLSVNNLNNTDINGLSETTTEANDEEYAKLNPLARFFNKIIKKLTPSGTKTYNKATIYENAENAQEGILPVNSLNTLNSSIPNIPINNNNTSNKINNEINKNHKIDNKKSEIVKNNNSSKNSNLNYSTNQLTNQSSNQLSNNKLQPSPTLPSHQSSRPPSNNNPIQRDPTLTSNKSSRPPSNNNPIQRNQTLTSNKSSQIPAPSLKRSPTLNSNKSLTATDKISNNNKTSSSNINLNKKKSEIKKKEDDSKSRKSESKTSTSFPFQKLDLFKNQNDRGFKYCHQLTQAGKDSDGNLKVDQDTSLIYIGIGGITGFNMYGVLDGHGPQGHFASQFCKDYFTKNITQLTELLKTYKNINTAEGVYNELKSTGFIFIVELFNLADSEIAAKRTFDSSLSGTTCNLVFQFNKHLVCFSVGDSRSILVFDKGDNTNAGILPLSTDHKPDLPGEIDRIRLSGGEVDRLKDIFGNKIGPPRVFQLGSEYPGLAMSRSLGDFQAKQVGVISSPQIIEYDINISTRFLVICSDGVWEFASNEQVRDIGNYFYANHDVVGYCNKLVEFSMGLWEQKEVVRDDITVVSVFF